MGLGKTIQGIASMSMYSNEWPFLVLCPSSARYHWASECLKWLGRSSPINEPPQEAETNQFVAASGLTQQMVNGDTRSDLLDSDQVHVLTSSKEPILPSARTKAVVCSYGLAPMLAASGNLSPGLFKCAIVDESHMLKNKAAKRTSMLIPILQSTSRCVLLSGTPALARPAELWPQLEIIGTQQYGWWDSEKDFLQRYAKDATAEHRAELHTLLTGTVMIRRLKPDILKTMPRKLREKAMVKLLGENDREEFKELLLELKQSKGALGTIARSGDVTAYSSDEEEANTDAPIPRPKIATKSKSKAQSSGEDAMEKAEEEKVLHGEMQKRLEEGRAQIHAHLNNLWSHQRSPMEIEHTRANLEGQLRRQLETDYTVSLAGIRKKYLEKEKENSRKSLLSRLYALTGNVKVPLVTDMLVRWLNDPTKGKVCIFAHHLSVLDAIADGASLSNDLSSSRKFIRIDGSTSPKSRQQQIDDFQTDPSIRVALLGITAAGVAVTLTASSTVWFAELFWTPALMIQAEDRAHRIGQASQVRCLYVVARGTLDE